MIRKRILVVDDDEDMRNAFIMLFEKEGFNVIALNSAQQILNGNVPVPDVYLLDRQLSGVDGLDLCRFIRRQEISHDLPVIIVSASPGIHRLAYDAGADGYIEKPFRKRDLMMLIVKCMTNSNP